MAEKVLKVGGVGFGIVGSIFASVLAEAGVDLYASDLPHRLEQIEKHGLRVRRFGKLHEHEIKTVPTIKDLAEIKPDIIFVATKTWALDKVVKQVAEAAGEDTIVLSVQNGIDPEEVIARHAPRENVARMVVNYAGANDASYVTSIEWFNPPNFISMITDREDPRLILLQHLLSENGLKTQLVDCKEIKKKAFLKTVLNSALMPLCGVLGLTMSEAMTCKIMRGYAGDLLREGLELGKKLGYDYGEDSWNNCMGYLDKGGNHYPSMYLDLKNKTPTEIEFLNGKIVELGKQFDDIDTCINRIFCAMVVSAEIKNKTRTEDAIPEYVMNHRSDCGKFLV